MRIEYSLMNSRHRLSLTIFVTDFAEEVAWCSTRLKGPSSMVQHQAKGA